MVFVQLLINGCYKILVLRGSDAGVMVSYLVLN